MDKYTFRRYLIFLISLFINALGVAFITRALLGTSPITSVTYVLSMFTPYTMGQWTIFINVLFVLLELPLMSRQMLKTDRRIYLLQIPISICFGFFIDYSMNMLSWVNPEVYLQQIGYLLVGCVVLATGIAIEVKANIAMTAGEYFVQVIARRFHGDFGYVKLGFDITLVATACLCSFLAMSEIRGVREGTVIAALLVGPIVHVLSPYCRLLDRWIKEDRTTTTASDTSSNKQNTIITIAREFGSGGHLIGEMLAKELGIRLYDKEFIHLAAQKSGMDEQYIVRNEQSIPFFWLKCILSHNYGSSLEHSLSPDDILFVAESKIIQEMANRESCIIIGRCADFILKDHPNVIKVFCYSDLPAACRRCTTEYGLSPDNAESEIKRINRNRIAHYEYYTGEKWGEPHRYDLMLNTSNISLSTASQLVKAVYTDLKNKKTSDKRQN